MTNKLIIGDVKRNGYVSIDTGFLSTPSCRANRSHYGQYEEVVFVSHAISSYKNWPIILDEIFRFAYGDCIYELRFNALDIHFSIPKFLKRIYLLSGNKVELISFDTYESAGQYRIRFKAGKREYLKDNTWSFCLLWDGKNEGYVHEFISSVFQQGSHASAFEIIICGPKVVIPDSFAANVKFIESDDISEKYSNISRKKNKLVTASSYTNICLVHNRYELDERFILSFNEFNYDYEICVVKQRLKDSDIRVPDWVSQASDHRLTANYLLDYGEYSPYQYIPGGIIVAKRDLLVGFPFNELAVWNMAEDVEFSQRIVESGYQFRLNDMAYANVLSIRKEILSDFHKANIDNYYNNIDLFCNQSVLLSSKKNNFMKLLMLIRYPMRIKSIIMRKLRS